MLPVEVFVTGIKIFDWQKCACVILKLLIEGLVLHIFDPLIFTIWNHLDVLINWLLINEIEHYTWFMQPRQT